MDVYTKAKLLLTKRTRAAGASVQDKLSEQLMEILWEI
jgi:hypothetical protein